MPNLTIIHHKGNCDNSPYPANSLEVIRASLEAGASIIEVDIHPLADGDYLVTHDADLESGTTGYGKVSNFRLEDAKGLTIKAGNTVTAYKVPLLSNLVQLLAEHDHPARLQLDFKHVHPFPTDEPLQRLLNIIAPIHERVIVSSLSDWNLRKLKRINPALNVGFDPMMYFDLRDSDWTYPPELPPFREGAYGYHDDSLLSVDTVWSTSDYVRDRCHTLAHQVTGASTLFMSHRTLARALNDGVNIASELNHYGMQVVAWTVDVDKNDALANAQKLHTAGFDLFISNTPIALAEALK